jgi:hypothetical protein
MDQNTTRSKKEVSSGIKISVVEVSNTTPVATVRSKNDSLNLEKKNGKFGLVIRIFRCL